MVPPPNQNSVGVCNQITLPIPYYISYRLGSLLKSLMILYTSLIFFFISLLVPSSSILTFRYSFFWFLICLLVSRLTLFILPTLLWFGWCNHCILSCSLWSKERNHSTNHDLCSFNPYKPIFPLAEVLIYFLMFSQPLFMSSLSFCSPKLQICLRS